MDFELHLGDCLEVLKTLPRDQIAAVVSDPEYGINANTGTGKYGRLKFADNPEQWDEAPASDEELDSLLGVNRPTVIWGMNYFNLPPTRGFLVWDKGAGFKDRDFAECELAWTNIDMNARVLSFDPLAKGAYRNKVHPTQKPVEVMAWCIQKLRLPAGATILDPYMGSGTTGVAAARLGYGFIGIELNPTYYAIASKRIAAAYAQKGLFNAD